MGHEGIGYIVDVGDEVHRHKKGDWVVVPDNMGIYIYFFLGLY